MTVQFLYNDTPSASLAVWMYLVPNETMRRPILLGRDSWMRFHSRSYQTLPPTSDGRVLGEFTPTHIGDNSGSGASAYIRNCDDLEVTYHLGDGHVAFASRYQTTHGSPYTPNHGPPRKRSHV